MTSTTLSTIWIGNEKPEKALGVMVVVDGGKKGCPNFDEEAE